MNKKEISDFAILDAPKIWKEHNKGLVSHSWSVQVFVNNEDVTNDTDFIDNLILDCGFSDRKDFFENEKWNKKNYVGYIKNLNN